MNSSSSPTTKSVGGKSFLGILALLAGEGSNLTGQVKEKRGCAAGWCQDKKDGLPCPEASILFEDGKPAIPALPAEPGTNFFFQPVSAGGSHTNILLDPEESTIGDGARSAERYSLLARVDGASQASPLKAFMTEQGLGQDAIEALSIKVPGAAGDEKFSTFINRLISAFKESGLSSPEVRELAQMIASLAIERHGFSASEVQSMRDVKELLMRMGITTQPMDKADVPGSISPDAPHTNSAGLAVKSAGTDAMGQEASLSETRQPADLWKMNMNPEQVLKHGNHSPAGENNPLESPVLQSGAANAIARPSAQAMNSRTAGLLNTHLNPGQEALAVVAGDNSGSGTTPNEMVKLVLQHAGNEGTAVLAGYREGGDDLSGQDNAGDDKYSGMGAVAHGADSGKTSSGKGIDFAQQISQAQGREVTAQKVMEQIVSGARMQIEGGRTRAKIFLQPPALGKINLHIVTRDDQVRVAFFAETPQVKEIIESNLSQLRQSFMDQGLRADNFEVFVGNQQAGSQAWYSHSFDAPEVPGAAAGEHGAGSDQALRHGRQRIFSNNIVDVFI